MPRLPLLLAALAVALAMPAQAQTSTSEALVTVYTSTDCSGTAAGSTAAPSNSSCQQLLPNPTVSSLVAAQNNPVLSALLPSQLYATLTCDSNSADSSWSAVTYSSNQCAANGGFPLISESGTGTGCKQISYSGLTASFTVDCSNNGASAETPQQVSQQSSGNSASSSSSASSTGSSGSGFGSGSGKSSASTLATSTAALITAMSAVGLGVTLL